MVFTIATSAPLLASSSASYHYEKQRLPIQKFQIMGARWLPSQRNAIYPARANRPDEPTFNYLDYFIKLARERSV
jgi:hypothetical protein